MKRDTIWLVVALGLAVGLVACSDTRRRAGGGDGGAARDAGAPSDAAAEDAAVVPADGGEPRFDGGEPGFDGGEPGFDAGGPGLDAGGPGLDAGSPGRDAGRDAGVASDAGRDSGPAADAGRDSGPAADAGPAPPCTPLPAAGTATVSGTLAATSPIWLRPYANVGCPASISGAMTAYASYVYCNTGASARTFEVAMDGTDENAALTLSDPLLVIYDGATIPADVTMCLAADDDGSAAGLGSLTSLSVAPGQRITIVASCYSDGDVGTWQLRITAL